MSLVFLLAIVNPVNNWVGLIPILINSGASEYHFECFVSLRLDVILLVLHQLNQFLDVFEVLEAHAQRLGLGVQSYKLADNLSKWIDPIVEAGVNALRAVNSVEFLVRIACVRHFIIFEGHRLIAINVALLIVLFQEGAQDKLVVLQQEFLHVVAVVEQLLDDSDDPLPVSVGGGEAVDVDHHVH